mgnify:CR=1 FL=1
MGERILYYSMRKKRLVYENLFTLYLRCVEVLRLYAPLFPGE